MKTQPNVVACSTLIFIILIIRLNVGESFGFTIDLIHRDSPKSPWYNYSLTSLECSKNTSEQSIYPGTIPLKHYCPQLATNEIDAGKYHYFIKLSQGTPPVESMALIDTGSDFIWVQCKPCRQCYRQELPIFDPRRSSTYKPLFFLSRVCRDIKGTFYSILRQSCGYKETYADGTSSKGEFAKEIINLGSTIGQATSFKVAMGCGHTNYVPYPFPGSGIIGLGRGKQSLITQLGPSIRGKFSYCLQRDDSRDSKLNFGDNAVVSGDGTVTTPIVEKDSTTEYFLTLEGITVGDVRLNYHNPSANSTSTFPNAHKEDQEGNIFIDTGTRYTYLPERLYDQVRRLVMSQVTRPQIPHWRYDLCYGIQNSDDQVSITIHFRGADVKLRQFNIFTPITTEMECLAFREARPPKNVFGAIQQLEFLVGYDLQRKTISFKPIDCSHE